METALYKERTILKRSFCGVPFKLADITEDKTQNELRLMLMCSSPGVLDGDDYEFKIHLAAQTSLLLVTQSYQRLFQMQNGASQSISINLQAGSSFTYLPHPVVPHKGSCFKAINRIYLTNDCTLQWGEVISCGRKLNNEVFQFTRYHGTTEIYKNGKLAVKENLLLRPGEVNVQGMGQMEGYTHQATFLYLNDEVKMEALIGQLAGVLAGDSILCFGISALPVNGLVVRLLGHKAELLFALIKQLSLLISKQQASLTTQTGAHV